MISDTNSCVDIDTRWTIDGTATLIDNGYKLNKSTIRSTTVLSGRQITNLYGIMFTITDFTKSENNYCEFVFYDANGSMLEAALTYMPISDDGYHRKEMSVPHQTHKIDIVFSGDYSVSGIQLYGVNASASVAIDKGLEYDNSMKLNFKPSTAPVGAFMGTSKNVEDALNELFQYASAGGGGEIWNYTKYYGNLEYWRWVYDVVFADSADESVRNCPIPCEDWPRYVYVSRYQGKIYLYFFNYLFQCVTQYYNTFSESAGVWWNINRENTPSRYIMSEAEGDEYHKLLGKRTTVDHSFGGLGKGVELLNTNCKELYDYVLNNEGLLKQCSYDPTSGWFSNWGGCPFSGAIPGSALPAAYRWIENSYTWKTNLQPYYLLIAGWNNTTVAIKFFDSVHNIICTGNATSGKCGVFENYCRASIDYKNHVVGDKEPAKNSVTESFNTFIETNHEDLRRIVINSNVTYNNSFIPS